MENLFLLENEPSPLTSLPPGAHQLSWPQSAWVGKPNFPFSSNFPPFFPRRDAAGGLGQVAEKPRSYWGNAGRGRGTTGTEEPTGCCWAGRSWLRSHVDRKSVV